MDAVYIFNFSPYQVSLSVNSFQIQNSMQPTDPSSFPPYVPDQMIIGRFDPNLGPPGTFVNALSNVPPNPNPNPILITIIGDAGQNSNKILINLATVGLPTPSLWLYLFHSHLVMFDTKGDMLPAYPIPIIWNPPDSKVQLLSVQGNQSCESYDK